MTHTGRERSIPSRREAVEKGPSAALASSLVVATYDRVRLTPRSSPPCVWTFLNTLRLAHHLPDTLGYAPKNSTKRFLISSVRRSSSSGSTVRILRSESLGLSAGYVTSGCGT